MREFEAVKAEVKEIEEKFNKKVEDYTQKYEAAQERKAAALEAAEKAYKKAKIEDYHKAQEEARSSTDAMELYGAKLEELKKEKIITKEQFEKLRGEIAEYLGGVVKEDEARLRDLVKTMVEIKEKESKILDEGNALIEHCQKGLLKDPCGIYTQSGRLIEQPNQVKLFKEYRVIEFVRFITKHPLVEDFAEKEKTYYWGRR